MKSVTMETGSELINLLEIMLAQYAATSVCSTDDSVKVLI